MRARGQNCVPLGESAIKLQARDEAREPAPNGLAAYITDGGR